MQSLTKIELGQDQLSRAVQAAWDGVSLVSSEEFHDGWFNTIHGLELSDGRRMVLKTAPKPGVPVLRHERNLLETEVTVYRLLETAAIEAPRVLFYEATGSVLGVPYFLMDRIDLPTYAKVKESLVPADRVTIEENLGRVNARLNSLTADTFGSVRDGGFRSPHWAEVFSRMVDDTLADGLDKQTALPVPSAEIRTLVDRLLPALNAVVQPRLVHWDLHDANVFVDGTSVAAIIDADRAQWADPLMEIYFSPFFGHAAFLRGYGSDPFQQPGAEIRRALYDLHLGLIMVIESDYRGFDEGHKTWAQGSLTEVLARCRSLV